MGLTDAVNRLNDPWHAIIDLALMVIIAVAVWKLVAKPVFGVVIGIGEGKQHYYKSHRFVEGMPENGAPTLWEMAATNIDDHEKIFACIAEIDAKLDVIVDRKPNGRRSYDPHDN